MTDDAIEVAPLPCPFCGREPKIRNRMGAWGVKCTCGGKSFVQFYGGSQEVAVANWNARAAIAAMPVEEMIRQEREACAKVADYMCTWLRTQPQFDHKGARIETVQEVAKAIRSRPTP